MNLFSKIIDMEVQVSSDDSQKDAAEQAVYCAECVLDRLHWDKKDIVVLIYATQSPKFLTPSTASYLFKRLGLTKDCLTYDIDLGSTSFSKGIQLVSLLLSSYGVGKKGLLLLGDDRADQLGFSDYKSVGSAAAVESSEESYIQIDSKTYSEDYKAIFSQNKESPIYVQPDLDQKISSYISDVCGNSVEQLLPDTFFMTNMPTALSDKLQKQLDDKNIEMIHYQNETVLSAVITPYLLQEKGFDNISDICICEIGAGLDISCMICKL